MGREKRRNICQAEVELNLAAMLDMAFQLLAFFIFTFKPAPTEGFIAMRCPRRHRPRPNRAPRPATPIRPARQMDRLETLMVTIKSNAEGGIGTLQIRGRDAERQPERIRTAAQHAALRHRREFRASHSASRLWPALRQPGADPRHLFARQAGLGRAIDQTQHHRTARGDVAGLRGRRRLHPQISQITQIKKKNLTKSQEGCRRSASTRFFSSA